MVTTVQVTWVQFEAPDPIPGVPTDPDHPLFGKACDCGCQSCGKPPAKPMAGASSGNYQAAQDVTLDFAMGPASSVTMVHLRFTARRRENPVTSEGEMLFEPGRQSQGRVARGEVVLRARAW